MQPNNEENPKRPLILSEREKSVYDLLKKASAQNDQFGDWYLGALQAVLNGASDALPQAAHSIREITDRLPSRVGVPSFESPLPKAREVVVRLLELRPSDYPEGWRGQAIDGKLAEILEALESLRPIFEATPRTQRLRVALERRDPYSAGIPRVHRKARDKSFRDVAEYFQKIAHHNAVPDREDFLEKLASFEGLLLSYLSPVTVEQQKKILSLITNPRTDDSENRLNDLLLHNGTNLLFVLQRLMDPGWLPFLIKLELFKHLREGEKTDEGDTVYKADPALSCLARLAPNAPETVLDILERLPAASNPQIPDQIMRCVAAIGTPDLIPRCLRLLKKLLKKQRHGDWIWMSDVFESWNAMEKRLEMIALLEAYLCSRAQREQERYGRQSEWQVSEIDSKFAEPLGLSHPKLVALSFFKALRIWKLRRREMEGIEDKLTEAGSDIDSDPATYWLTDFRRRTFLNQELEGTLATRLYEIGSSVFATGDEALLHEFDTLLRSDKWELFSRLRWQLYAEYPTKTCSLARADVLPRISGLSLFRESHGFEMAQMLEAQCEANRSAPFRGRWRRFVSPWQGRLV